MRGNSRAEDKFYKLVKAVEAYGPELTLPHNKKLDKNLYELRDTESGKRYYYVETAYDIEIEDGVRKIVLLLGATGCKNNESEQRRDVLLERKKDYQTLILKIF